MAGPRTFASARSDARGLTLGLVALANGCGSADLHVAGAPPAAHYIESFAGQEASVTLGQVRLKPEVCKDIDTKPAGRPLDAEAFTSFVREQGLEMKTSVARHDLVFVDLTNAGTSAPVRFRVAVLDTPGAAGSELHRALLQHGEGTWGVHRGNLAVLAPRASVDDAIVLAAKTKLACWGTLMIAGRDDTFVVPGGYYEL